MEGNNQNNADNYMPQEIPIPGVSDTDNASTQQSLGDSRMQQPQDNSYNSYGQQLQDNSYTSYGQQPQDNSYNPYGQQPQDNLYNLYGQQSRQSNDYNPNGQSQQSNAFNPYGQSQQSGTFNSNVQSQQSDAFNPYGQSQQNDAFNSNAQSQQSNAFNPYEQSQQNNVYNPYGQPQQNNPYGQDSYQSQGGMNGQQIQPYNPKGEKKGAAKIIIAVACICVVLIAVIVGAMVYFRSTPAYKISKGFQNIGKEISQMRNPMVDKIGGDDILLMMENDGCHVDTKLDFTVDLPMVGSTTIGVDTDFYKDMNAKELNADTSISMYNYDFAHLNIYANDEVFCFSIPELFIEDMYIENENVVSQYNDSILADFSYQSDEEDFSINLFSGNKATSIKDWKSFCEAFEEFESDLNACKDGMSIEKVEKGLYRVTFPQKETNRLVTNFMNEYAEIYMVADDMGIFDDYDEWISSDLSLLFEINSKNRIESIMLEDPVEMLDGEAAVSGEIFFLGENRSIEKIQGKLSVEGVDGETREIIGQLVQDVTEDDYQVTMDLKYSDGYDEGKMKYVLNCDAGSDEFDMTISVVDDYDDLDITLEGSWDDIVKGKSMQFNLDKLIFSMDDEELFQLSGEIEIEPIEDKIKPSVEPKTAFFEMTMSDWEDIIDQLDDEYGSLLDALW